MSCLKTSPPNCALPPGCPDYMGCPPGRCPDFIIKRHDTKPWFKIPVNDDNGDPLDLTGLVLEANMWVCAKLKTAIDSTDTTIQFADNIGFNHILVNDVIVFDRVRSPESMLVIGFDEAAKTIEVYRGYNNTTATSWNKGDRMRIFRIQNSPALTEMLYEDVTQVDGCVDANQLAESFLVYQWNPNDTCVPGCFWFEFKLLKMATDPANIPSYVPYCSIGSGVEWARRYPVQGEYLIRINDSPTAEV